MGILCIVPQWQRCVRLLLLLLQTQQGEANVRKRSWNGDGRPTATVAPALPDQRTRHAGPAHSRGHSTAAHLAAIFSHWHQCSVDALRQKFSNCMMHRLSTTEFALWSHAVLPVRTPRAKMTLPVQQLISPATTTCWLVIRPSPMSATHAHQCANLSSD
jgi:hypothetical protein